MTVEPRQFASRSSAQSERGENSPSVFELPSTLNPMTVLKKFSKWTMPLLLDSAATGRFGKYSFFTADPIKTYRLADATLGCNPFEEWRKDLKLCNAVRQPDLPPFQGGIAGLLGYEISHAWENLPSTEYDEFQFPAVTAGLYDWVIAWDHEKQTTNLIVHDVSKWSGKFQNHSHQKRIDSIFEALDSNVDAANEFIPQESNLELMAQFDVPSAKGVKSNFSQDDYLQAVDRVLEYIRAGDIFQANLSQRLMSPQTDSPLELYSRLRERNSAPFAGYFADGDWAVLSASPERFLQVEDDRIYTRPIKGTRSRVHRPEADLFRRDELKGSEKDRAENVMIVDLLRNDLSKVAQAGSVKVPEVCSIEFHETVQHMVSEVQAKLKPENDAFDLLSGALPGGSITGAPKIRAMEIITELERTARGPYCGSLFYHGFDGTMDSNLLIRTFLVKDNWVQFSVGGGIVAQSDPEAEYAETMHKAAGMLRALHQ